MFLDHRLIVCCTNQRWHDVRHPKKIRLKERCTHPYKEKREAESSNCPSVSLHSADVRLQQQTLPKRVFLCSPFVRCAVAAARIQSMRTLNMCNAAFLQKGGRCGRTLSDIPNPMS